MVRGCVRGRSACVWNVYRACISITRVLHSRNADRVAVCVACKIFRFIRRPGGSDVLMTFLS